MSALTFFEALQKSAPTGCGVLVIQDGKLLTGTRMDNGRICGPGGHIEPGEAPEEAAKREAFEEFGITCKNLERIGTIPGGGRYCTSAIFLCTSFSGTPEADGEEMTDASWRTLEEIRELDLFLSFERSLSLLGEDVKKFNHNHDPKNGRFTTGSNDADYMKAISDGDIDSVSKMVKNAAVRAGYRVPAFHGTPSGGITSFDENSIGSNTDYGIFGRGFYFSTNKKTADGYKGESGEVMPVYLKVDNPYWMNGKKISDVAADLNMDESAFSVSKLNSGHIVHPTESTVSQFTSHLIEKGYDSVVVQHGSGDYEVVVFSNKQIKSAEPVTRGDDGEVIPLSERFKSDNSDIRKFNENHDPKNGRFTTGTGSSDEKYLKAVSSGDTETAQIMVNEAADRVGYKTEAYHGTTEYDPIKSFKKGKSGYLGPGIYLALDRDQAQQYADKMGPGNGTVYNLRVKANKPFVAKTNDPAREILKEIYGSDKEYEKRSANQSMATMWIQAGDIKKLQKAGYDSVKWDFGKYPELMVFDSSQVKSSDPVTYDKKNPVPLSERFNSESKYIAKYNHNHDPKTGRFTSGRGGSSGSGVSEEDQKYWDVVDSGDDKAAKKMLDEAAAEKGFTEIWSHGSNDASFTEFDLDKATGATAVFLSDRGTASEYAGTTSEPVNTRLIGRKIDNVKDAISEIERITGEKHVENDGGYSRIAMGMKMKKIVSGEELIDRANRLREGKEKGGVYDLYVNKGKCLVVEAGGKFWNEIKHEYGSKTDGIARKAKEKGYDSVEIRDVVDGAFGYNASDILVVFDPARLKSADIDVYDGDRRIPLSERFSYSKDIRKFNPYHDEKGRFTTSGDYTSFTYSPGKSKAHDLAIQREKDRNASRMPTEAQGKTLSGIERRTRNLKKEQFRVVDRDGNVIMEKQGDESSVSYKVGEARDNFPGNITIHNHPDGGTFSSADLSDIGYGATEIRAATPEGTYILRNSRYGGKYDAAHTKTWFEMRDDLDAASSEFKSTFQLKKEVRKPFDDQLKPIVDRWNARRAEGASQEELTAIANEYSAACESVKPQIEKAVRTAYVNQYHSWYMENAGKYGMEYEFIPVDNKTQKSYDFYSEVLEKSDGEITLDGDSNKIIEEVASEIMRDILSDLPGRGDVNLKVAKKFSEIIKYNHNHDPKNGRFTTGDGGSGSSSSYGANGVTTKEQDEAYAAAVAAGDMETAQQMVIEAAKAAGAQTFANPDTPAYSIRRGAEPQETVTVYKTFFVDENGNPSALFVEGGEPLPVGVWLDAKDAYHFTAKNGKDYTPSRKNPNSDGNGKTGQPIEIPDEETRQELIKRGFLPEGSTAKSVTALAYRPGWHAGDLPFFPQGGKQGNPVLNESGEPNKRYDPSKPETNYQNVHRWNQVVFECEMIADKNYTNTSLIQSGPNKGKTRYHDMQTMPSDGYYQFATNPMTSTNQLGTWYISGSLKIKRALSQSECDKMLTDKGFKVQEWEGGTMSLDNLHYDSSRTSVGTKLLDAVTYDDSGKMIPLSERFNPNSTDVRKSMEETVSIYKTDEDKRLVFGWASVALTVDGEQLQDRQNDMIDPDDLEEAVYEYVLKFRDTGEEHVPSMRKKGKLVESCVLTKEKQEAMGIPEGIVPVGWWIGFKIEDDDAWARVKDGTYKMFSIEGKANREEIEKGLEDPMAKSTGPIIDVIYEVGKSSRYDHIIEVMKMNDNHDPKTGRFTFAPGGAKKRNYGKADLSDVRTQIGRGEHNSLEDHLTKKGNLTREREKLHREIIDKMLEGKVPVEGQATMTMLGGGPASGKSSVLNPDTSNDPHAVTIDPDAFKAMLPGYAEMAKNDEGAASYYHEESSMLAKRFAEVAYKENYNAIYDGTGDGSVNGVLKKIKAARDNGYRVEAKYVSIDTEEALRRNEKRYLDAKAKGETPRLPPANYVADTHAKVTDISVAVAKEFDHIEVWDNNGARGQQKLIATGGSGKNLSAVKGQEALFDRYLSKGVNGIDGFITLPDGQVVPVE